MRGFLFRILARIFPIAECLVDAINQNIKAWEKSKPIFKHLTANYATSYEILTSQEFEDAVQAALGPKEQLEEMVEEEETVGEEQQEKEEEDDEDDESEG